MKETETVEFKKSFAELKAGLVSFAAILNKHGAGILSGLLKGGLNTCMRLSR